jgi:hypothetical protein
MNRFLAAILVVLGTIVFAVIATVLFPYFIAGLVCRLMPFVTRRKWIVTAIALLIPVAMRFGFGHWNIRFGGGPPYELANDLVNLVVNLAFSHIFVWAGFLSLEKFLEGLSGDTKPESGAEPQR